LVLTVDGGADRVLEELSVIPLAIFKQVIVLRAGEAPGELSGLPDGIDVRRIGSADPLRYVRDTLNGTDCEQVVFLVAGGRRNGADVSRLIVALERGYDLVVASRFAIGGGRVDRESQSPARSVGNRVFTVLANLTFNGQVTDVLNPFLAISRRRLLELPLRSDGVLGLYQLSLTAMRDRWRVSEIPTVETVGFTRSERVVAWGSVVPMLMLLWKEWRTRP
jgi:hypothetical protein